MDLTQHPPGEPPDGGPQTLSGPGDAPLDLAILGAVHQSLLLDARGIAEEVVAAAAGDRDVWAALREQWAVISSRVQHLCRWEASSLWAPVSEGARAAGDVRALAAVANLLAAAVVAVTLVDSCRPVFDRLAIARDEDSAATLAVRVRAACASLEVVFDLEAGDAGSLPQRYVSPARWQETAIRLAELEALRQL